MIEKFGLNQKLNKKEYEKIISIFNNNLYKMLILLQENLNKLETLIENLDNI